MTVVLASHWGGSAVDELVADALAVGQAVAKGRNSREIELADLAAGLLSLPDGPARRAMKALRLDPERLATDLAGSREPRAPGPLPQAGAEVLAIMARAPLWRGDSGDQAVGLRLLGEIAKSPGAELQPLRDARISTDRLRWAAARCGIAYAPPDAQGEPLQPPATPELEELRERTPGRRSAAVASVMREVLPQHGTVGTPYGMVRARRWSIFHLLFLCARPLTALAIISFGIRAHSWWSVSAVLLMLTPELVPMILSVVSYVSLAVIVSLEFAWPFLVLTLVTAVTDYAGFWYQWWMKRIDECDPSMPVSAIRKGAMQQADHLVASWRLERARGR